MFLPAYHCVESSNLGMNLVNVVVSVRPCKAGSNDIKWRGRVVYVIQLYLPYFYYFQIRRRRKKMKQEMHIIEYAFTLTKIEDIYLIHQCLIYFVEGYYFASWEKVIYINCMKRLHYHRLLRI